MEVLLHSLRPSFLAMLSHRLGVKTALMASSPPAGNLENASRW